MASVVSICNLALSNIGKENISALTEPNAEARACSQFYDHSRDVLLQGYPWRWAGATVSMAEVANDRDGQWDYAYQLPNDCLKVRWIRPDYSAADEPLTVQQELSIPYEIQGAVLYCDISPAFLHYTARVTDPSKFPPLFVDALAAQLSVRLAMPLTRDPSIRGDAFKLANLAIGAAQMADANDQRETSDHASELITGRV